MIVLDTDHLSILQHAESAIAARLVDRLERAIDRDVVTTLVSFEEQMRGWLAEIRRKKSPQDEVPVYDRLGGLIRFYAGWGLLPFDPDSATIFQDLRRQRVRIGTSDLKIASIVLTRRGTLLSANLSDFGKVPGLQVEDWLRE
jgi:tRNA(fMet)-specific endonuclease VapC